MHECEIFGKQEIEEQVLQELIESQPVQRLKHIQQSGPQKYFMDITPITRYEHSIGVMLLLKQHNASLEEQIAGLLHDVPHTAFSHLVDFVFETKDHEYHENFKEKIVYDSEIPQILEKHGYQTDKILDETRFKLLERDMPALCGDRIEYSLRYMKKSRNQRIEHIKNNIETHQNLFVLKDKKIAEEYALQFIKTDKQCWADPKQVATTEIFARMIRRAFELNELQEQELFGTDNEVYQKIIDIQDDQINDKLRLLNSGFDVKLVEDKKEADISTKTKARYIDPHVKTGENLERVSDYSEKLNKEIKKHKEQIETGYNIKISEN